MTSTLSNDQLKMLCDIAIAAGQEAAQWIEEFDRQGLQREFKNAGSSEASQIVTQVDIRSEEIIRKRLEKVSKPFDLSLIHI